MQVQVSLLGSKHFTSDPVDGPSESFAKTSTNCAPDMWRRSASDPDVVGGRIALLAERRGEI